MTLNEYQEEAKKTAIYPQLGGQAWVYPALGLSNEAGEILGKLKKVIRDSNGEVSEETKQALKTELGDVLWYIAQLSREFGFKLDDVAKDNVDKLASRQKRGKLKGSGDNR